VHDVASAPQLLGAGPDILLRHAQRGSGNADGPAKLVLGHGQGHRDAGQANLNLLMVGGIAAAAALDLVKVKCAIAMNLGQVDRFISAI
jgi:hypothetical protein